MDDRTQSSADEVADMDSTCSSSSSGEGCSSIDEDQEAEICILCELVGARHLTIQDESDVGDLELETMRPYCTVKFGDKVIHKTSSAGEKGCNPIWTVSTGSLFLLQAKPSDMIQKGLIIKVFSKREQSFTAKLMKSDGFFLGQVYLDASNILSHCDQQRFEVQLEDEIGEESSFRGTLALRFRIAIESDQQIARLFHNNQKIASREAQDVIKQMVLEPKKSAMSKFRPQAKLVTETDETEVAQTSILNALNSVWTSSRVIDKATGSKKFKVKPYPDPLREEDTKFMSKQDMHVETRSPSHTWVEAGSGTLGKLYCEVLACHDLPNVDIGEAVGNVTDSFVCLVYEDTCAMTEVIDDELSPHWLPWTQRAFCFGMMHPASILYLGVFDYDLGTTHEALGRVAVNVSNLQRNTVHTLKYNLYPSSNVTDRTAVGSITIRLRIECPDEKAALLAALKPRPKIFINVKKEKSFKVIRYTCFGEYDGEESFDLTVTRSYVNEIFAYKAAIGYTMKDTFTSLVYWRGQVRILNIMVPLHSFLFFCMAVDFIERPHMVVPYTLLCISWVMLANLTIRRQHPSPWNSSPSFWHFLHILRTGKALTPVSMIKQHENEEAALAYEKAWADRLARDQELAEKRLKLQQELLEIGDDNISTKTSLSAIPLDLLARLARWQGIAGRYCGYFRFMKIILTWEESFVSFWITASFLGSGIVAMFLPWKLILTWVSRIVVWGFLGPHMKFVDLYFRANSKADENVKRLMQNFDVQSNVARLRREEAVKAREIKSIAFGKYSIQVPSFNIARHFDRPLPESSARLSRTQPKRPGMNRRVSVASLNQCPWIPGQQLFGVMIPRPEHEAALFDAELERHQDRLDAFKDAVESKNGGGKTGLRKRLSLDNLRLGPRSLGYEVVPEDVDDDSSSSAHETKKRTSAIPDEEGLEIVGLGRYSTLDDGAQEDEHDILTTRSSEAVLERQDSKLSTMYKSSEKVEVAFYRPLEHIPSDMDDYPEHNECAQ